MNFLDFLGLNNTNTSTTTSVSTTTNTTANTSTLTRSAEKSTKSKTHQEANFESGQEYYCNLRVGDRVEIVRYGTNNQNCYVGYIGDIKSYRKGSDHASVFLHAISHVKIVKFPLQNIRKLDR